MDFPIEIIPKVFDYTWYDLKGNETNMSIIQGDPSYEALKNYLISEQYGWRLMRSDQTYVGHGFIVSQMMTIICPVEGDGAIIEYKRQSQYVVIGKDGKNPCVDVLNSYIAPK